MTREEYNKAISSIEISYKHYDPIGRLTDIKYLNEFYINSLEQQNTALQARIKELEEEYSKQEYRFSCVLDNSTGGKASKTNIDLDIAYKLISDNVNFWVNSAVEEIEKEYQELGG